LQSTAIDRAPEAEKMRRESQRRLLLALMVALIWAGGMLWWFHLWWSYPEPGLVHVVIVSGIGSLLALLWGFGWLRRPNP
jgi:hypothetical protein